MNIEIEYSKAHRCWCVFEGPIWYAQCDTYEQALEVKDNLLYVESEDQDYE